MSKHIYNAVTKDNINVCITMGYDRKLQCLYLDIERINNDSDEVLYESYNEENTPYKLSLGYFIDLLKERFGISLPKAMLQEVLSDKEHNIGNKIVVHD
jgi:hypothetical protein